VRDQRGFSTIEVLVALVLLGGILLGGLGFAWQQRLSARRLAAHRAAEATLENAYERLRRGALPIETGPVAGDDSLWLDVRPGEQPGTVELELTASYDIDGIPFERGLSAVMGAH
jgi:prepilin-type N-terminal cleavage/methylation domain-containing protein